MEKLIAITEWASGDLAAVVEWDHGTSGGVAYHQFARKEQIQIREANQQPNWGTWYAAFAFFTPRLTQIA